MNELVQEPAKPTVHGPLLAALLQHAPRMNFFQLCQLLELQAPQQSLLGTCDTPATEALRFLPRASLGFPATEMALVEHDPERPGAAPTVRTSFLGLYGVNAAMAHHFLEDIVLRREGSDAIAAFLDLFNHRIATLFYRGWRKYRYPVGFRSGGDDVTSQYLLGLAGFGIGQAAHKQGLAPPQLLASLGLLTQRTRTADGLAGMLRQLLQGAQVRVTEFHPVWVRLQQPQALGRGKTGNTRPSGLGDGHVLGRALLDRTQTVRVTIVAADVVQANALLPGAQLHGDMRKLLRVYLGYKADAEIRLVLSIMAMPLLKLRASAAAKGDDIAAPPPRLGWSTLLKPVHDGVVTIALGRYCGLAA